MTAYVRSHLYKTLRVLDVGANRAFAVWVRAQDQVTLREFGNGGAAPSASLAVFATGEWLFVDEKKRFLDGLPVGLRGEDERRVADWWEREHGFVKATIREHALVNPVHRVECFSAYAAVTIHSWTATSILTSRTCGERVEWYASQPEDALETELDNMSLPPANVFMLNPAAMVVHAAAGVLWHLGSEPIHEDLLLGYWQLRALYHDELREPPWPVPDWRRELPLLPLAGLLFSVTHPHELHVRRRSADGSLSPDKPLPPEADWVFYCFGDCVLAWVQTQASPPSLQDCLQLVLVERSLILAGQPLYVSIFASEPTSDWVESEVPAGAITYAQFASDAWTRPSSIDRTLAVTHRARCDAVAVQEVTLQGGWHVVDTLGRRTFIRLDHDVPFADAENRFLALEVSAQARALGLDPSTEHICSVEWSGRNLTAAPYTLAALHALLHFLPSDSRRLLRLSVDRAILTPIPRDTTIRDVRQDPDVNRRRARTHAILRLVDRAELVCVGWQDGSVSQGTPVSRLLPVLDRVDWIKRGNRVHGIWHMIAPLDLRTTVVHFVQDNTLLSSWALTRQHARELGGQLRVKVWDGELQDLLEGTAVVMQLGAEWCLFQPGSEVVQVPAAQLLDSILADQNQRRQRTWQTVRHLLLSPVVYVSQDRTGLLDLGSLVLEDGVAADNGPALLLEGSQFLFIFPEIGLVEESTEAQDVLWYVCALRDRLADCWTFELEQGGESDLDARLALLQDLETRWLTKQGDPASLRRELEQRC